ncbi:hypothetical protein JHK84_050137 [Glycine max]|nr:hypothetical protein JHK84_050137 [Glycine max]
MYRLSQLSSYTASIVGSTVRLIANRSLHHQCCSLPAKPEYRGIRSFRSEFAVTTRCYSAKKGRKSKVEPEAMKQEKDAFYVVRKGDVVGIYNSLADSQAQVGSSVCNPPVSVFKGYSLSKDTEEYLVSHGLKNALYTIRATDLKEDLFGMLVPCPLQEPSTKESTSNKDVSKKRSLGVLGQDEKVISEDPLRKQVKLDHAAVAEAPLHATVSGNDTDAVRFYGMVYVTWIQQTCFVEFDGASKGNPGKAGAGAILRANDGSLIDGSWKVKNENLSTLYNVAKELKDKFSSFQISHVLRNFNSDADAQANLAINLAGEMAKFKKSVCNSLMAADDYVLGLLQNTSAIYRLVLRIGDPVI